MDTEEDGEDVGGLGSHLQGIEEGGDEEVAFWPGQVDSGAVADRKRLDKLIQEPLRIGNDWSSR
jgi:hypothetical protein